MMSMILCFFISFVFAQTNLEPVYVEASKDVERLTFSTSSEISSRTLETQPMGIISPELKKIPGVIAIQDGGPGGRVSFFIRGTETRHVSFTLDGLKLNDIGNTDRQFDASFITSPFVKNVTIFKGPQAVLYGSDALGGMVEMTTRKGENAPETRLNINVGSFGTIGTTLGNDWQAGKNSGTLTATRFHTDGISRLNDKRYDADEKDATDITQLTSSSRHQWANRVQSDLLFSYLHGKSEQDGFDDDNSFDIGRSDQYIVQQKTNIEIGDYQAISIRNGFNRHQRNNDSLIMQSEFFNGNLLQNEIIHRGEIGPHGFLTGISADKETASTRTLDRSLELFSAFFQTAFEKNDFKFHAGVRADKHSRYDSFFTGSVGAGFKNFALQYSRGYKAPTLYQLYGPDSFGSPVGNPELEPETNHYLEASWKEKQESWEGEISLFQNRLSNLFDFEFGRGYFNHSRFIAEGIEVSGKISHGKFDYFTSFTHQQFKDADKPVLRRPYNTVHAGVSWFLQETLEINATGRWLSARKDVGNVKLNPYEVVDLGIRKTWEKDEVSVQIINILNREYEEIFGFSTLPRSVFMNYGHRF